MTGPPPSLVNPAADQWHRRSTGWAIACRLDAVPGGVTAEQIAERFGMQPANARRHLRTLEAARLATRAADGRWTLGDAVPTFDRATNNPEVPRKTAPKSVRLPAQIAADLDTVAPAWRITPDELAVKIIGDYLDGLKPPYVDRREPSTWDELAERRKRRATNLP